MKKVLSAGLLVLLLLPALAWGINARTHQLGQLPMEGEKARLQHMRRISATSFPVLTHDRLFLISISDPYIYEFTAAQTPEFLQRYPIGGKDKAILYVDGGIVIGFQEERISHRLVSVRYFDYAKRSMETLIDTQSVSGEMNHNLIVHEGWMYVWGFQEDTVQLFATDGTQVLKAQPDLTLEVTDQVGFHLDSPIENLPRFDVSGTQQRSFHLSVPEGRALTLEEAVDPLPGVDEAKFNALAQTGRYSHFYLQSDQLLGRFESDTDEWEDQLTDWVRDDEIIEETSDKLADITPAEHRTEKFALPELTSLGINRDTGFLYPDDLIGAQGFETAENDAAVELQKNLVAHYQREMDRNEAEITAYQTDHQLVDYLLSPTSLVLILVQMVLAWFGFRLFFDQGDKL